MLCVITATAIIHCRHAGMAATTKEVPMKLVNQQLIKNTNLKLLYNSIFENRGISRAALAKKNRIEPHCRFSAYR